MNNRQLALILKLMKRFLEVTDTALYDNFYVMARKTESFRDNLHSIRKQTGMIQLAEAIEMLNDLIRALDGDEEV